MASLSMFSIHFRKPLFYWNLHQRALVLKVLTLLQILIKYFIWIKVQPFHNFLEKTSDIFCFKIKVDVAHQTGQVPLEPFVECHFVSFRDPFSMNRFIFWKKTAFASRMWRHWLNSAGSIASTTCPDFFRNILQSKNNFGAIIGSCN